MASDAVRGKKCFPDDLWIGCGLGARYHAELRLVVEDVRLEPATEREKIGPSPKKSEADHADQPRWNWRGANGRRGIFFKKSEFFAGQTFAGPAKCLPRSWRHPFSPIFFRI